MPRLIFPSSHCDTFLASYKLFTFKFFFKWSLIVLAGELLPTQILTEAEPEDLFFNLVGLRVYNSLCSSLSSIVLGNEKAPSV